jgi:hypothetical protein
MQISRVMGTAFEQFVVDSDSNRLLAEQGYRMRNAHEDKVTRTQPRKLDPRQSTTEFMMLLARKAGGHER